MKRRLRQHSAVIFDGDDTLWHTTPLYLAASERFAALMRLHEFEPTIALGRLAKIDQEAVAVAGFSRSRFPMSLRNTYRRLCATNGRVPLASIEQEAVAIGEGVFGAAAQVDPAARDVLGTLRSRMPLILFTKGDRQIQEKRIKDSGLGALFDHIHITPDKSQSRLSGILDAHSLDAQLTWSVGNSARSDINPALGLGIHAIWIPRTTWSFEEEPIDDSEVLVVCQDLSEIPRIVLQEET